MPRTPSLVTACKGRRIATKYAGEFSADLNSPRGRAETRPLRDSDNVGKGAFATLCAAGPGAFCAARGSNEAAEPSGPPRAVSAA